MIAGNEECIHWHAADSDAWGVHLETQKLIPSYLSTLSAVIFAAIKHRQKLSRPHLPPKHSEFHQEKPPLQERTAASKDLQIWDNELKGLVSHLELFPLSRIAWSLGKSWRGRQGNDWHFEVFCHRVIWVPKAQLFQNMPIGKLASRILQFVRELPKQHTSF